MPNLYDGFDVAGEEISSTYEGRHITRYDSLWTHPTHTDGFVDAKDPNNPPVGRWKLSFLGNMKQTLEGGFELIVEVVGSGKEGVVQGLSAKSIYTFDFAKHTYKTEGFIL